MKNKINITKIKIPIKKPRNPLVTKMLSLKAGSHEKTEKSLRRKANMEIKDSSKDS